MECAHLYAFLILQGTGYHRLFLRQTAKYESQPLKSSILLGNHVELILYGYGLIPWWSEKYAHFSNRHHRFLIVH